MKLISLFNICILFFLVSCQDPVQEITWETKKIPKKLVVDGSITNITGYHPLELKLSDDYFVNKPLGKVSGAIITVTSSTQQISYIESDTMPGYYSAEEEFEGIIGENYKLSIQLKDEIEGEIEYSASAPIIQGMHIDSIAAYLYNTSIPFMEEDDDNDTALSVLVYIYGLEPVDIQNYYVLKFFRNGEIISDTINDWIHFKDASANINGSTSLGFLLNEDFDANDTITLDMLSVTNDYHLFLEGVNQIAIPGDPFGFSGSPANAVGNINNGKALGFFLTAQVSSGTTTIIDKTD